LRAVFDQPSTQSSKQHRSTSGSGRSSTAQV
jgi:hypothetical protein